MKKYNVVIKGKTPYMQHRMDDKSLEEWEKNRGRIIERPEVSKEDIMRAEYHAYKSGDDYFIPSDHVRGALIGAGSFLKSKVGNAKKSMKNVVAAMFFVYPQELPILNLALMEKVKEFSIDKRSAVNKNIKARIITIRPRWDDWATEFTLEIDNDTITKETVRELIQYAGNYVGIGSFRPTANGMFGRFEVHSLEEV